MNKRFQKGLAVSALAAMVVAPFAQPVFAIEAGGSGTDLGKAEGADTTLVLKKDLTVQDLDSDYVPKAPDVSFKYSVTNGEAGKFTSKQEDKTEQVYEVKAGENGDLIKVNNVVKENTINFSGSDTVKSGKVTKDISLDFSDVEKKFTSAGIYRYVITEGNYTQTDRADLSTALPQTGAGEKTRYIDVYVEEKAGGGFEIKGYVVSRTDTSEGKESGFTEEKKEDGTTPDSNKSSVYSTYDVTLTKKVAGAVTNNAGYTFTVTLPTDDTATYFYQKSGGSESTVSSSSSTTTFTETLKKDESFTLKGLPVGTTIGIAETEVQGFKVPTVKIDAGSEEDMTGWAKTGIGYSDADADATDVVVTNKKDGSILPPTGILMTIAPFAAMVGLGAALIALFAKKRKNEA